MTHAANSRPIRQSAVRLAPFSNREIVGCDAKARAGHRVPPEQQLVDGVVGQVVGIVAIGMTARDAASAGRSERVPNLPRCALVGQTPGERLDHAVHTLSRLEQDSAAVGTVLLIERGDEGLGEQIREQNRLWYR